MITVEQKLQQDIYTMLNYQGMKCTTIFICIQMYISFNYRETKVYFTKEILGKCVYMQFTIPESTYIAEIPNHEEKNL